MADKIIMPQLGESIAEGTIVKWFKKPGDAVKKDENVVLISTDKVEAEIPAPNSGALVEILVEAGQTVPVGTVLGSIGEAGAQATRKTPESKKAPEQILPSAPESKKMPATQEPA